MQNRKHRPTFCRLLGALSHQPLRLVLTLALCLTAYSSAARAAIFTVTSLSDSGDGTCDIIDVNDGCTLREAIEAANSGADEDTVKFDSGVVGTIQLNSVLPTLNTDIKIQAPAPNLVTVRGYGYGSIFTIYSATVTISGLTITNGQAYSSESGGGIYNAGVLTLSNVTVSGNKGGEGYSGYNGVISYIGDDDGDGGPGADGGNGGGIYNYGTMTISNSTISNNSAGIGGYGGSGGGGLDGTPSGDGGPGGTGGQGGGIYNEGTLSISNSTISNNSAGQGGYGGWAGSGGFTSLGDGGNGGMGGDGGGIYNVGFLTISNTTLGYNYAGMPGTGGAGNYGGSDGADGTGGICGGIYNDNIYNGTTSLGSTIVASDVTGDFNSQGYNLLQSVGAAFVSGNTATDITGQDPLLGTLKNNGGPTFTHQLLTGSPALDKGKNFGPTTDQRGQIRPSDSSTIANASGGDGSDIGALEMQAPIIPKITINDISVTETNGGSTQATFTLTLSAAIPKTVTVKAQTTAGGGSPEATPGSDYVALPSTLVTFNPGQTTKTVSVTLLGDTLDESDEKFTVTLSGATNSTIADNTGLCTIIDNDDPPTISVSAPNVTEGNTGDSPVMTFTIKLSAASARNISVQYQTTAAGTLPATAGTDYTAVGLTTVIFTAGQTTKTVNVTVKGDILDEDNERIKLNLTNPVNATLGTITEGVIVDDDATPSLYINDMIVSEGNNGTSLMTFSVNLSAASGRTVTVSATTGNGGTPAATAGVDYLTLAPTTLTFAPGQTTKTVSVTINGDKTVEQNEKLAVILSSATNATISDNAGIGTIFNDDFAALPQPTPDSSS